MQDVQPFGPPSGWRAGRRRAATLLALGLLLPGIDSRAETFDVARGSTEDVTADLGGGATVVKQGAGTLRMTTDQTFTGDVTVDDGTLIFYGAATPAAITVNGGTLMLGGETAGGITLNGGRLAIGSQRSISWTSIDPGGNKIRDFIPSDGKNADWNFGSAGTFYAQNWAAGLLQPQAVIDAGLPDSGLVTSLADPSIAYQFKLGGLDGGRINSNSGGDTAFIVIPDEQRANFVEMQTLLGTNQLGSGQANMDFLAYARYADAPSSSAYAGRINDIPLYTSGEGTPVVAAGRVNKDTNVFSTEPIFLYQGDVSVDPTRRLDRLGIVRAGQNGNSGGYFALSGMAVNEGSVSGSLTVAADATLDLAGAALADGVATLAAGELILQGGTLTTARSVGHASPYVASFSGLRLEADAAVDVQAGDGGDGTVVVAGITEAGGPRTLTKVGPGSLAVSADSSFAGSLLIQEGAVEVGFGGTSGSLGSASVVNDGSLTFNRSDDVTFSATVSGSGSLTQAGSGLLTLDGAGSTYSGGTTVTAGGLRFASPTAIPASGLITVQPGGALIADGAFADLGAWLASGLIDPESAGTIAIVADDSADASFAGLDSLSLGARGAATFSGGITPGAAGYRLGGGGGSLTVSTPLSGEAGLVVVGPGTVNLTGSNDFTGGTDLAGGELVLGSAAALGTEGEIAFTGGTLVSSATDTTDYSARFSRSAGQAFRFDTAGQSIELASSIVSNGGTLTKLGGGTLTLAADNAFSGDTRIVAGTLKLADPGALAGSTVNLFEEDAGDLVFDAPGGGPYQLGGLKGSRDLDAGAASLVIGGSDSSTYSGTLSAGSLTKRGTGSLTLTGSAALTGSLEVGQGTLTLDFAATALPDNIVSPTTTLTTAGGTLRVLAADSQFNSQAFAATSVAANASSIAALGGTAFNLDVQLGTLTRSAGATLDVSLPEIGSVSAAVANTNGIIGPWMTVGGATWAVSGGDTTFAGPIFPLDEFSYAPVNIFGGLDTLNSVTSLSETMLGSLETWSLKMDVTEAGQIFSLGSQGLTLTSGGLLVTAPGNGNAGSIIGSPGQAFITAGDGLGPAELIIHQHNGSSGGLTISASITDNGSAEVGLTKAGGGLLTLAGENSFTGPIRVLAGRLAATLEAAAANAASIAISPGTGNQFRMETAGMTLSLPLEINGGGIVGQGALQGAGSSGATTFAGPITITGPTQAGGHFGANSGGELVLSGPITHAASQPEDRWISSRAGTVVLASAASDYAEFQLAEGTLRLGVADAIPTGGSLRVGNIGNNSASATFDLGGFDQTLAAVINNMTGSNAASRITSTGGPATLTLTPAADTTNTYTGRVTGEVSLAIQGPGTFGLTAANDSTGSVIVAAGTLALGPAATLSASPLVEVAAAATLDVSAQPAGYALPAVQTLAGGGTVAGSIAVGGGGTLAPGASPGTLSVTETVTMAPGGNYNWQIAAAGGTAGGTSGWDLLSVGGVLEITATAAEPFGINLWSLSGVDPDASGDVADFNPAQGYTWTIATAAGGITGYAGDAFTISTDPVNGTGGFTNDLAGGLFSMVLSGNDLNLVFIPGSSPTDIVIDVPSGVQSQADAGYPTIAAATSVTKIGAGTVVFDAANAYSGPTTVSAGTLEVANPDALAATSVTVDTAATLAIAPGVTMRSPSVIVDGGTLSAGSLTVDAVSGIASLAINAGTLAGSPAVTIDGGGEMALPQDARVSVAAGSLAVAEGSGGGRLDLGAGQVSIAAGGITAEDLRADIIAGRNGGAWDGAAGIISAAAATSGGTRAVGYVVNGDGSAAVSFAAPGDTDLNGQVNVFDLIGIDSAGKFGNGQPAVWSQGDFNYDGVANVFDLIGIDSSGAYGAGPYFPAGPTAAATVTAVPEPAGLCSLATVIALGLLAAARRRQA